MKYPPPLMFFTTHSKFQVSPGCQLQHKEKIRRSGRSHESYDAKFLQVEQVDSIKVTLVISKRWVGHQPTIQKGHVFTHHPKKSHKESPGSPERP